MPWYLEIPEEPLSKFRLIPGVTITVGRSPGVTNIFPTDSQMSPVHFAIGLTGGKVRLQNFGDPNRTEVNGQQCESAALVAGDRIKAGNTVFVLRPPAESPYAAKVRIGGWGVDSLPQGWEQVEDVGFHLLGADRFTSTITAGEEPLPAGQTLASYLETQLVMLRAKIPNVLVHGPAALEIPGSEEAHSVHLTFPPQGQVIVSQRQIYALSSGIVGVLTATFSESILLDETLESVLNGLSYFQS
jgi:hypothetical protein